MKNRNKTKYIYQVWNIGKDKTFIRYFKNEGKKEQFENKLNKKYPACSWSCDCDFKQEAKWAEPISWVYNGQIII